jgi:hypothetical protein
MVALSLCKAARPAALSDAQEESSGRVVSDVNVEISLKALSLVGFLEMRARKHGSNERLMTMPLIVHSLVLLVASTKNAGWFDNA